MSKRKPRLLDLFCKAGGASAGYVRAGFRVTGVDVEEQPNYLKSGASEFVRADALDYLERHGREYDVIAASPPCQCYTKVNQNRHAKRPRALRKEHPDLVAPVRELLIASGRIYIIENVVGAPLRMAVTVCGSSLGLKVRRHRLFESNAFLFGTQCRHDWQRRTGSYPTCWRPRPGVRPTSSVVQVYGNTSGKALWPEAMGIDWMTSRELSQAIPPRYTEYLGKQLRRAV